MCGPSCLSFLQVPGSQTTPRLSPTNGPAQYRSIDSTVSGPSAACALLALKPASGGTRPSFGPQSERGAAARQRGEGSCTALQPSPAAAARHHNSSPSHNEPGPSHARGGVLCGPPHGGGWQPGKLGELTSWLSRQPGGLLLLRPRCNTSLLAAVLPATTPTECHGPHGTVAQADGCLR